MEVAVIIYDECFTLYMCLAVYILPTFLIAILILYIILHVLCDFYCIYMYALSLDTSVYYSTY